MENEVQMEAVVETPVVETPEVVAEPVVEQAEVAPTETPAE